MDSIAVYLHWPFCIAKCPYCDFVSYPCDANSHEFEALLLADLKDTISRLEVDSISSVFFGGGTPSLLSPQLVEQIINFLSPKFVNQIEISLEANPATFDEIKIQDFRMSGINRISLGIQSFQEKNLNFLGRAYSSEQAEISAALVAKYFENFSFDFIYGCTAQSMRDIAADLKRAITFGVKHVSCYQLTLEPGTPFYARQYSDDKISDDVAEKYMEFIEGFLAIHDIFRYEVSNFSTKNYEAKHNLTYWNYGNYLGCGPSAHSRLVINNQKHATTKHTNLKNWKENIGQWNFDIILTQKEILEEMVIAGLRKISGIAFSELYQQVTEDFVRKTITDDKIDFLLRHQLIYDHSDRLQLTHDGLMKLDSVIDLLMT